MTRVLLALAALAAAGCHGREAPLAAADYGRALFSDPRFSGSQFNVFSCATCHAATPDGDGPRIARSLRNSAFRRSFWGGYKPRLLDAVNFCYVFFMRGDPPLDRDDPRGRALYEYLVQISPERPSAPVPLTIVENISDVGRGDPARGRRVWDATCRTCHGDPHTGRGRLADFVSIVPEDSLDFAREAGVAPALVVVEKVRHGQFFGVGGNMPPFSREVLSDADLGALLAYLGL